MGMTPEEAIEDLKYDNERCLRICEGACLNIEKNQCNCRDGVIERMLDELLQYREIGTVEECREAVEKQRTKKIIIKDWNPTKCPTCGHELSTSLGDGYYKHPIFLERCPECGQAIQWDENLEGMEE